MRLWRKRMKVFIEYDFTGTFAIRNVRHSQSGMYIEHSDLVYFLKPDGSVQGGNVIIGWRPHSGFPDRKIVGLFSILYNPMKEKYA